MHVILFVALYNAPGQAALTNFIAAMTIDSWETPDGTALIVC